MLRPVLFFAPALLIAQSPADHWVETWAAAQQAPRTFQNQAPPAASAAISNQTVRMTAHASLGGRRLRIELSNTYETEPLRIGAAHVALRAKESSIAPGSDRTLAVNGKTSFTVPAGATILTDPVDLELPALSDLAVSLYIPGPAVPRTQHTLGLHTTYISSEGDFTAKASMDAAQTAQMYYWLSGIQVLAPQQASTIVAFGDSITDGFHSTPDANRMWPAVLAERIGPRFAIANEAISGNQLLHDGLGVNGLARFDHDVLSLPGVSWIIVLEGINDIGRNLGGAAPAAGALTADDVIAAYRQIIERSHEHGIKVAGATLTPYEGAAYASEKGESVREAVNAWIRSGGAYDAVIDFDSVTRDPVNPKRFRPEFDSGDHLHPNDAGYKAMADSIDLAIFRR